MTWKRLNSVFTTQVLFQIIVILSAAVAMRAFFVFG